MWYGLPYAISYTTCMYSTHLHMTQELLYVWTWSIWENNHRVGSAGPYIYCWNGEVISVLVLILEYWCYTNPYTCSMDVHV